MIGATLAAAFWYLIWSIRPLPVADGYSAARLLFLDIAWLRGRPAACRGESAVVVLDLKTYVFAAYDIAWRQALDGPRDHSIALLLLTASAARFQVRCWMFEAAARTSFLETRPLPLDPLFDDAERLLSRSRSIGLAIQIA